MNDVFTAFETLAGNLSGSSGIVHVVIAAPLDSDGDPNLKDPSVLAEAVCCGSGGPYADVGITSNRRGRPCACDDRVEFARVMASVRTPLNA